MRSLKSLLLVLMLMILIPCLMPFRGFGHVEADVAAVEQADGTVEETAVGYAAGGVDNSRVWVAFAMASIAAGAAWTGARERVHAAA